MKVDIAIITIRGDEFTAVRKHIKTKRHQIPHGRTYLIGEVRTGKQRYTIAIARCMEQGTDAAQRLAHDIIHDLGPQLILVVGIAGGVPHDEFTLGDVVVSTRIVNPNVDTLHPDGTTDYTTRGGPPHPLVENIVSLLPGDPQMVGWTDSIQYERPTLDPEQANITGDNGWCERVSASLNKHFGEADKQSRSPIFTIGPVLSSNHLMKDPARLSEILKTHRSILAVEMEVAGVYEAAQGMDHQYPVMAIRGISDIVGLRRDNGWTEYACQSAAAFTYAFIMTDPLDLPPKSARSRTPVAPSEVSSTQPRGSESSIYPPPSVWHSNFDLRGQYVNGPQFNAENIFNQTPAFAHFIDSETLEAAQQKFAQLPLDTIPEVAPLPAGSFMPFSRNPLFVGHEGDLQVLAKMLKGGEVAVIGQTGIAAATGMGGIGKTQLASEFVHRYGQYFPGGVIWLNFSDEVNIQTEIAKCCAFGCLGRQISHDNISLEERIRLVLSSWQSPMPRLLIFDNCEDEALLEQWRPHTGGSHILITSLRPNWNLELGVKVLKMDVLSRVESVELLCKSRKDLSREDSALGEIADELGYLPLALHLAGSFLSKYSHTSFGTPVSYLARLRQTSPLVDPSLQVEGRTISTGHIKSLKQTFHIAFERLKTNDEVDVLARKLLARAVYFAPNVPSPDYILHLSVIEDANNIASMELMIEDALDRLITLGLLERFEDGVLRLHRLIKEVVRITMEGEESTEAQKAVEMTLCRYTNALNEKILIRNYLLCNHICTISLT